jgi:hypothetical protein
MRAGIVTKIKFLVYLASQGVMVYLLESSGGFMEYNASSGLGQG